VGVVLRTRWLLFFSIEGCMMGYEGLKSKKININFLFIVSLVLKTVLKEIKKYLGVWVAMVS
jgi:hypothetical protein